jgi:bifunctional non-homologous end joining protein LigD
MADLDEYRRKRDPGRTPEPVPPPGPLPHGADDVFVIQEHHARRLHWDVRFEREGVLVSWAVPKGLPVEPGVVRLAVHTEDHPLEYAEFAGDIPHGEYGGGSVTIWDRGTYETEKWLDREVAVVLHGNRVSGRYLFIRTGDKDWLVRRRDPPQQENWQPLPGAVSPMLAVPGSLPPPGEDDQWSFEPAWGGLRALAEVDGGRVRLYDAAGEEITGRFTEVRGLGEQLGSTRVLLDGELMGIDADGRAATEPLAHRADPDLSPATLRKLATSQPIHYVVSDVLHLDGRSLLDVPFAQRRELLVGLAIDGPLWHTAPAAPGAGADVLAASTAQGLPGVLAKRLDSRYLVGKRSREWLTISGIG